MVSLLPIGLLGIFGLMFDDEPVPVAPEDPEPSREEVEQWLTLPSHTRSEVVKALDWRALDDAELLPLIRSRQDLCDADPDILMTHVWRRLLLIPTVLHRVAAPSCVEAPPFDDIAPVNHERIRRALFDAYRIWLVERYIPLAHAQIWCLWPEHNLSAVKNLIVWRLDVCCVALTTIWRVARLKPCTPN
jgi:hypothetical protein